MIYLMGNLEKKTKRKDIRQGICKFYHNTMVVKELYQIIVYEKRKSNVYKEYIYIYILIFLFWFLRRTNTV
jgi:hypothetical protein